MKKIILTGFQPFGGYSYNPTQDLVAHFKSEYFKINGIEIIGIVLPCTYYGAFEELSKLIDREKPDAIISTGLSSKVRGIRFETTFKNRMQSKYKDAGGLKPNGKRLISVADIPKKLSATANNLFLANMLSTEKIPFEISDNANAFICNSLAYLTTKKILDEGLKTRNLFIHIPWTNEYKLQLGKKGKLFFINEVDLHTAIELIAENI